MGGGLILTNEGVKGLDGYLLGKSNQRREYISYAHNINAHVRRGS